ncbi:DNA topology modulation protein FlaR [Parvularcula marina]|uniref:DNA topology modulation protein FlaR n=1 Tax=Parvularcula marina TaxID=2292771 RepID=A0A371RK80_9PROT|nr:DNA topology modulation protein FlaR [Parvularcula marina]RFB05859.1 DNA topology modulation protein FlaR [Parvularcula marina]
MELHRIMIIGGAGAGKSTLARQIGERLSLPVIHLDAVFWQPGWVEPDRDTFNENVRRIIEDESWVIEGNYSATWPERAARADLIVFLDVSTGRRIYRAIHRSLTNYGKTRQDMAPGCVEKFDPAFIKWVADYRWRGRPKTLRLLEDPVVADKAFTLRNKDDVSNFLATLDRLGQ